MRTRQLTTAALTMALLWGATAASAQDCLHGQRETAANRARREQALKVAVQINAAEAFLIGLPGGEYRPPEQLRNVGTLPPGFQIQFHTDGPTYTFSIKDTLDPCRYTIFSDQDRDVYEATPSRQGGVILPVQEKPNEASPDPGQSRRLPTAPLH